MNWLYGFWASSPPALNVVCIVGTFMMTYGLGSLAKREVLKRGGPVGTIPLAPSPVATAEEARVQSVAADIRARGMCGAIYLDGWGERVICIRKPDECEGHDPDSGPVTRGITLGPPEAVYVAQWADTGGAPTAVSVAQESWEGGTDGSPGEEDWRTLGGALELLDMYRVRLGILDPEETLDECRAALARLRKGGESELRRAVERECKYILTCSIDNLRALNIRLRLEAALAVSPENEEAKCTDLNARWCPIHGNCTCVEDFKNENTRCPLHGVLSNHAPESEVDE